MTMNIVYTSKKEVTIWGGWMGDENLKDGYFLRKYGIAWLLDC